MEPSSGPVYQLLDQYLLKIPTAVWSPILTCFCIQSDVDMATSEYIHLYTRCRHDNQCLLASVDKM